MGNNYYDTMNKPRREKVLVEGKLPEKEIIQVKKVMQVPAIKPTSINVANNSVINETVEKIYWDMHEASKLLKVTSSKLRYWEEYFNYSLNRGEGRKMIRIFTKKDIAFFTAVYNLVQVECYTLKGAKKQLQLLKLLPNAKVLPRKKHD